MEKSGSDELVWLSAGGSRVALDRGVFAELFGASVVSNYAGVRDALDGEPLPVAHFLKLARQAEIPYPLFFASREVVHAQLEIKTKKLMAGFTRDHFSVHSRQQVALSDIELIVKDLLRKQELLRSQDKAAPQNKIVGLIKASRGTVEQDAQLVRDALDMQLTDLRRVKSKEAAVEFFIRRLEAKQVLVARSAPHFMPQEMPSHVRFSGITVKDKKFPFIFLGSADERDHDEPAGRRLFTLALLTVLIARDLFAPVNYESHSKERASPREYDLAAEVLMPGSEIDAMTFPDLDSFRQSADALMVTPSAVVMRAWRRGRIGRHEFDQYIGALKDEHDRLEKPRLSTPLAVNALKKYNGTECARRLFRLLDEGGISRADFRRIVCFNKIPNADIGKFRRTVFT